MPASFDLHVATVGEDAGVELRLLDADGSPIARQAVRIDQHPASRWEGLFDLRGYAERYARNLHPLGADTPLDEPALVRELSVFLGQAVLGGAVLRALGRGIERRTLRVHLPRGQRGKLAASLGRVPWEIARLDPDDTTLAEKNVLVRALTGAERPAPAPLVFDERAKEALRVLLVFAETREAQPLAARLERRRLLALFHGEIYACRRVQVDTLIHGVTRARLERQIQGSGGYHVVHWSGHGHRNRLALYSDGDEPQTITGEELVALLGDAGGYVPRLMFLGACHSGHLGVVRDWTSFQAAVEGRRGLREPREPPPEPLSDALHGRPGYTGTAQALLEAGVPTVVAMRYEVGDEYSRELAVEFYRRLLADPGLKPADEALNQARRELGRLDPEGHVYSACDHVTPVLYGAADPGLAPPAGSTDLPLVHPLLTLAELGPHRHFVGRTWELARLGRHWLDDDERPVAVVRGLGGLGKTALAAEVLDLWHAPFKWVFAFQAKGGMAEAEPALTLDDFLRQLHLRWADQSPSSYARRVAQHPAEAVWREAGGGWNSAERERLLRANLVAALRLERVLLILDNFESNLRSEAASARGARACRDPAWDELLRALATGLRGTRSRVLLTTRHAVAALEADGCVEDVLVGPLPPSEAALYVRTHAALRRLYFEDDRGRARVLRLLDASRGHPLLLDRLARLDPAGLDEAVRRVEKEGLARLPGFLASDARDAGEREYLEDALASSLDLLIERALPEARRMLWVLSLAHGPVAEAVWREAVEARESGPAAFQGPSLPTPPERPVDLSPMRRDTLGTRARSRDGARAPGPGWDAHVAALVHGGLVHEEREGEHAHLACHELVGERIAAWMAAHPQETGGRTRAQVWTAYAESLVGAFQALLERGRLADAMTAGRPALRYFVRAGAFDRLATMAGSIISSDDDPTRLRVLVPEFEYAARLAPPGEARWSALLHLADALRAAGKARISLVHYEEAAGLARAAQHWSDLAAITGNWAHALRTCGAFEEARDQHLESARLKRRAGRPASDVLASELEALRIDVMLGRSERVLPQATAHAELLRAWRDGRRRGETVPEAPGADALDRAQIGALDVLHQAHLALEHWQASLDCLAEMAAIHAARGASDYRLALVRFNRYGALLRLGQADQARAELEQYLAVFDGAQDHFMRAKCLSALADASEERRDYAQAVALERRALTLRNALPDPVERAGSHNNLGFYLHRLERYADAARHELAALLYRLVLGHAQHLDNSTYNHGRRVVLARRAGREHVLPRVDDLLSQPEFETLRDWLTARPADLEQLQRDVDTFAAGCRTATEERPAG